MEAGVIESQKDSAQSTVDTNLTAQQFYRHDPLLFLFKQKLQLSDFWISAGTTLCLGGIYLIWWLLSHVGVVPSWSFNDSLSSLIQTFVLFPFQLLIYAVIPHSIAKLFNTLYTDGVIGTYRKDRSSIETYCSVKLHCDPGKQNGPTS